MILVLDKETRQQRNKSNDELYTDEELWRSDLVTHQLDNGDYKIVQSKYGFNDTVDEQTLHEIVQCHLNYFSEGEE